MTMHIYIFILIIDFVIEVLLRIVEWAMIGDKAAKLRITSQVSLIEANKTHFLSINLFKVHKLNLVELKSSKRYLFVQIATVFWVAISNVLVKAKIPI